jgi:hypothetical protein
MRSLRNTERVFSNSTSAEVLKRESADPGNIEAIRDLVKGERYRESFLETGNPESSVWSCGQVKTETTLETGGEDVKLHSKRVEKM